MSNGPLTRKKVHGTFTATFEGDYIPVNNIEGYLQHWIDSGLDDRADLKGWNFICTDIYEEEIPEDEL